MHRLRVERPAGMWRSVAIGLVLAGLLAGCSWDGSGVPGPGSGDGIPQYGVVEGRVVTKACDLPGMPLSGECSQTPYRGSLVFCTTMSQTGPCPSAHVDATGHYRIALRRGRHALIAAPASGNVVRVDPRWVLVVAGHTETLNIEGGLNGHQRATEDGQTSSER